MKRPAVVIKNSPIIKDLSFSAPIYVTRALVPSYASLEAPIRKILKTRCLTNQGNFVIGLEKAIAEYLDVERSLAFCNGTLALQLAILGFRLSGEIITTPFTFPATAHVIQWNNIVSVFADVDPHTFNMAPASIERLITRRTSAILPVHVFGVPCDVHQIQRLAARYGLKVIYDAAHAFGVKTNGISVAHFGDASMFSFHATKIFNTLEGGALVSKDRSFLDRVSRMRNFGFGNEGEVETLGINAKMSEIQAAFGLNVLGRVSAEAALRAKRYRRYRHNLEKISGIGFQQIPPRTTLHHQYMPILVTPEFGLSRNRLFDFLRRHNVIARKYFYPLCSGMPIYRQLASSSPENLPQATRVADQILCLPLYGDLPLHAVDQICELIRRAPDDWVE